MEISSIFSLSSISFYFLPYSSCRKRQLSLSCVVYQYPSNQIYQPPQYDNAQMSAIRKFDEIYQQQHRYESEQHHFVHLKQQNLSFRVANTYIRQNFLRSHETNSFRIPQGELEIMRSLIKKSNHCPLHRTTPRFIINRSFSFVCV
jgi:hypothetical protein